jgi:hypothetical protein
VVTCALAGAGCGDSHSCSAVYYVCDQTDVTLQSPSEAWTAGTYALALTVNSTSGQCTIVVPDSPPVSGVQGTCGSGSNITLALVPVDSCPPVVCDSTACKGMSCTPIPGHFQMTLVVQGVPPHMGLNLSLNGKQLMSETIAPKSTTTEPNGAGCGTCTLGSATVSVEGG